MKPPMIKMIFVVAFAFVSIATNLPTTSFSPYKASSPASNPLAEDLRNLCQCVEKFGPPAPVLNPTVLPVDVSLENNQKCTYQCNPTPADGCCQPCFNCYGWQLLIALNWPAKSDSAGDPDPGKGFGDPGDYSPVVWQTYKSVSEIFTDGRPTAWGNALELEANSAVILDTYIEAHLQADHNWLTDQDGEMARYEIRINKDEFNYILQNNLWHQEGLFNAFTKGPGIVLPSAKSEYGEVGAIEVKAAWRIIPDARHDEFIQNYKVAKAKVYDPIRKEWKDREVALVGLHLIKKTPNSPQWVWATFEHKDNAPVEGDPGQGTKWNFYNPDVSPDNPPSYKSPPGRSTPKDKPVQVVRVKQPNEDDRGVGKINEAVHRLIVDKYPNSVWRNYNLISVQWPRELKMPDPKVQKVLPAGEPRPRVLANTTMETYAQLKADRNVPGTGGGGAGVSPGPAFDQGPEKSFRLDDVGKSSCIGCHRVSAITPKLIDHPGKRWWTDYSTIFFKAKAVGSFFKASAVTTKKGVVNRNSHGSNQQTEAR